MTNAEIILRELDRRLSSRVELNLFGRAALSLGFEHPREEFGHSLDVDAVLPVGAAEAFLENTNFWKAVEQTNEALAPRDLYVSHFFTEDQVILTERWMEKRIPIQGDWERITLFRLSDEDLLLSKLMRDDPHDFEDALFIVETRDWNGADVKAIVNQARIPDSSEIREEFAKARDRIITHLEGTGPDRELSTIVD